MPSPRQELCASLSIKWRSSFSSASLLARSDAEHAPAAASRTFYAVLQGVACQILRLPNLGDDKLLGNTTAGLGICRTHAQGRWGFVHGKIVTNSDLVLTDAKHRSRLKAMEAVRNAADYHDDRIDADEVEEQIQDAHAIFKALNLNP